MIAAGKKVAKKAAMKAAVKKRIDIDRMTEIDLRKQLLQLFELEGAVAIDQRRGTPVGHETILVVDDEPGVRLFTSTVLQRHGYNVLEAESAETAMARLATDPQRVDLLLIDLMLPGMDGTQLALNVRRTRTT